VTPVRKRKASATARPGDAQAKPALKAAPSTAETRKTRRALNTSATFSAAYKNVPVMKPAWTAMVSQAAWTSVNPQAARSVGMAAVPENHVDPASRTASDTPRSARVGLTG
jgi:hypothetical protein